MNQDDTLLALSAEQMVLFELVAALVTSHPEPKRVHLAFLQRMQSLLDNAPEGHGEDYIAEIRARMAQYSALLGRLT